MAKILLVDDELTMVQMVAEVLRAEGHTVFPYTNASGVAEALTEKRPDLVITDLYLDKTKPHGLEIIRKARALNPPAVVVMRRNRNHRMPYIYILLLMIAAAASIVQPAVLC